MAKVRLDRLLSLYLGRSLASPDRGAGLARIPILMYHNISSDLEEGVEPYYRVATDPLSFSEQMRWISDLGGKGVALEEALSLLDDGKDKGSRPVAITFDDGYRDFYTEAWPVLRRHGFSATVYLPTALISRQRKSFRGKECLTWDEVRELRQGGVLFGSHTVTHPKLYELPWEKIIREITDSKECMEQELQTEVTSFAYPYAFPQEDIGFVRKLADLLRQAGYWHCATTVIGRARVGDNPFTLKRLPANSCDDQALFMAKLDGAYDWLGVAQGAYRQFKWATGRSRRNGNYPAKPISNE